MTVGGTHLYLGREDIPPLVADAVELARTLSFEWSCRPEQGRLLAALAGGRGGGVIGETGTGCGVGLAWMASAVTRATTLVSVERDDRLAAEVQMLFDDLPNVSVICGDWTALEAYPPFDLLVLDGGGSGKDGQPAADPNRMLVPGGTVVIDDFAATDSWPPRVAGEVDQARLQWLHHPELLATQVMVAPDSVSIVATRRPPRRD